MTRFLIIITTALLILSFQNCAPVHEQLDAFDRSSMDPALLQSIDTFEVTLYPYLRQNCVLCHGDFAAGGAPGFAASNVLSAHTNITAAEVIDFAEPSNSLMISQISGNHNGFGSSDALVIEGLINDWVSGL